MPADKLRKVQINLVGIQAPPDEEASRVELYTEGVYEQEGEIRRLLYEESLISNFWGTRSILEVQAGQVQLMHRGVFHNDYVFELGRHYDCYYRSPIGMTEMTVRTTVLEADLRPEGGHVDICYDLEMEGTLMSVNELHIRYEQEKKG